MSSPQEIYDNRYSGAYREVLSGYEVARWHALQHFVRNVLKLNNIQRVLDYGSGSGLYVNLWKQVFPGANLSFCDLSPVALGKLAEKFPEYKESCYLVKNNTALIDGGQFDVITSVEVMEHVQDLDGYLRDIKRLLKPNGYFIWTTPCANILSIEHIYGELTGQIEKGDSILRIWKWDDPEHLRRLKTREIRKILMDSGFHNINFRFRAHLFSFLCTKFLSKRFQKVGEKMMLLDYMLFRRLPNAASMIGSAQNKT